jgi:hypothetical protein
MITMTRGDKRLKSDMGESEDNFPLVKGYIPRFKRLGIRVSDRHGNFRLTLQTVGLLTCLEPVETMGNVVIAVNTETGEPYALGCGYMLGSKFYEPDFMNMKKIYDNVDNARIHLRQMYK